MNDTEPYCPDPEAFDDSPRDENPDPDTDRDTEWYPDWNPLSDPEYTRDAYDPSDPKGWDW